MDRRSATILGVIFIGLFLALFAFVGLVFTVVDKVGDDSDSSRFGRGSGPAIGVVEIRGEIRGSDKIMAQLRRLSDDDDIKAILVRIDSPGGTVGASQEIYSELRRMAKSVPVVCSMGDLAASGGYYIASACDFIFANAGTLTGSIGVIMQAPYLGGIAEKFSFQMRTIKAGANKDIGNSFRQMTPEESALLQAMLDDVHQHFIHDVALGRKLDEEEVRPWADGRIMTGSEALEHGFVDRIGSQNDAIRYAAQKAGLSESSVRLRYMREDRSFSLKHFAGEAADSLAGAIIRGLSGAEPSAAVPAGANGLPMPMLLSAPLAQGLAAAYASPEPLAR